jgi:hypothetical protein
VRAANDVPTGKVLLARHASAYPLSDVGLIANLTEADARRARRSSRPKSVRSAGGNSLLEGLPKSNGGLAGNKMWKCYRAFSGSTNSSPNSKIGRRSPSVPFFCWSRRSSIFPLKTWVFVRPRNKIRNCYLISTVPTICEASRNSH